MPPGLSNDLRSTKKNWVRNSEFFCERSDSNCLFLPRSGAGLTLEREESLTIGIATIVKIRA
jgi:hypothetical protein